MALRVVPMNQTLRLIGNDRLFPLRTLGGFVFLDQILQSLYKYFEFKDCSSFLEKLNYLIFKKFIER